MQYSADIPKIAREIDKLAKKGGYRIGNLQQIRKELLGHKRLSDQNIFREKSVFEDYAFHYGGRSELQFNIGVDPDSWIRFGVAFSLETSQSVPNPDSWIRFGVAFSLETSQSVPNIVEVLRPKIRLFNEYIKEHYDDFSDMRMWHVLKDRKQYSGEYAPSIIPSERIQNNTFIFLGIRQQSNKLNYPAVLELMDRLLPLYVFIESEGKFKQPELGSEFRFKPGHTEKRSSATTNSEQKKFNILLKHNDLQKVLYQSLTKEYGKDSVGTEIPNGREAKIDIVVQRANDEYWFYEIKTALTAKACIRQAIGQLLEYAYWPKNQKATRLIVVGEPELNCEAKEYINTLKKEFSLPIEYQSLLIKS